MGFSGSEINSTRRVSADQTTQADPARTYKINLSRKVPLGFFGAMLMPSTLSLLRNTFVDRQQRRLAIAIWAAGFSGGAALGPIVGGFLLEHYWWGSVFLMAVPVLVLLLILAPIFVPES
ncbi:MAG TPA: MFS transporter, partial [Nakamurella sp.]|nr:MFS transporter [Nakamurella sp.]